MTHTTKRWGSRPPDVANLFNPAFCALLLNRLAAGYNSKATMKLPYVLPFLAIPILLHPPSTSQLPKTSRTSFHGWLLEHPTLLVGFSDRATELVSVVREALAFGLAHNLLMLDNQGRIAVNGPAKNIRHWEQSDYNNRHSKDAQLLGKLLAQVEDVTTIFALFGIRP